METEPEHSNHSSLWGLEVNPLALSFDVVFASASFFSVIPPPEIAKVFPDLCTIP